MPPAPEPPPPQDREPLPTIPELRRICQDPVRGFALRHDPLYRVFSIYLTRLAIQARLTPHQVTNISLLCGLAAGWALCGLSATRMVLAFSLLQAYLLLDYVDGEVARFRKLASMGGRYYEQAGCYAVDPFILLGAGWGAAQLCDSGWVLALGVLGALTQVYFRLAPVLVTAVITSVHMGSLHRGNGEATPEPPQELPPLDRWGRTMKAAYPFYRRLRFPFFHPNFLLLLCLCLLADVALAFWQQDPILCPLLVLGYGLCTPVMAVWQVLNILHLRIADRRYNALYLRGESFREHI